MQVVEVDLVFDRVIAVVVGRADADPASRRRPPATGERFGCDRGRRTLGSGRAAEFAAPDHQCVLQKPRALRSCSRPAMGLSTSARSGMVAQQIGVLIPLIRVGHLHESHALSRTAAPSGIAGRSPPSPACPCRTASAWPPTRPRYPGAPAPPSASGMRARTIRSALQAPRRARSADTCSRFVPLREIELHALNVFRRLGIRDVGTSHRGP